MSQSWAGSGRRRARRGPGHQKIECPRDSGIACALLAALLLHLGCGRPLVAPDAGDTGVFPVGHDAFADVGGDVPVGGWDADADGASDAAGDRRDATGEAPASVDASSDAPSRVCPPRAPGAGLGCADYAFGLTCNYADPAPSSCSTRCECRGQSWICDRPCATGACPPNAPANGASCSPPNLTCAYTVACGAQQFQCSAFEVGAPAIWTCRANCSCDGGADGPRDGGAD